MTVTRHPGSADDADRIIGPTLLATWSALPALLVASVAVCAAATAAILIAPGVTPVSVLVAALLIGPLAAPLAGLGNDLVADGDATVRGWARHLRSSWRFGLVGALVPAIPGALFVVAIEVLRRTGNPLVWPSFAVTGAVTVLAALAAAAAFPLGVARPDLRGRRLWTVALAVVSRHPIRFVAVVSAVVTVVWAATAWSASLLLFLPAPAAIVSVLATWTSGPELRPSR